jgi:hypothetical protein
MDNTPVPFGYKIGWLAVRSTDRDSVVRSLQLSEPIEVTWKAGIDAVYNDAYRLLGRASKVFVSPPVDGWVFVVGDWTMGSGDEQGVHSIERLITRASAELREVQAFATSRVIDYHHWMIARDGALSRAFAISGGELLADFGEPTPVELGFSWYPLRQDADDADDGEMDDDEAEGWPNEESVMKVAGEWSVNPQLLGPSVPSTGKGVLAVAPAAEVRAAAAGSRRPWWKFW